MNEEKFNWKLERAVRDGLPPSPGEAPIAREQLSESDRRILAEYPAEQMTRNIRRRLEAAQRRRRFAFSGAVGLAAAAACALVLTLHGSQSAGRGEVDDTIRFKGGAPGHCGTCGKLEPHLHLFSQKDGRSELTREGSVAQAGDHVQLGYHAGATEGVIVSIDGRGGTTLHWPAGPGDATRLAPGDHLLAQGFELDDAPHFERFFLVTGEHVSTAQVMEAARQLAAKGDALHAPLPLPGGLSQSAFTVRKPEGTPPR